WFVVSPPPESAEKSRRATLRCEESVKRSFGNEGWRMRSITRVMTCSLALGVGAVSCSNEPEVVKPTPGSGGASTTSGGGSTGSPGGSGGSEATGSPGGSGGTGGSNATSVGDGGSQAGSGGTAGTTNTSTTAGGGEAGTPGVVVPEVPELVFEG